MSIYGNLFDNKINNVIFYEDNNIFDFVTEAFYELDNIFERANVISILKEGNNELAVPFEFKPTENAEETKKTFLQKVKEIVKKIYDAFCKKLDQLKEFLYKKYMETNLTDKFFQQFAKTVTYDNLTEARRKGWKGLPNHIPMIGHIADPKDSDFIYAIDNNNPLSRVIISSDDAEKVFYANTYEEAQNIYNELKKKISEFKSEGYKYESFSQMDDTNYAKNMFQKDLSQRYFLNTTDSSEEGYYYPSKKLFENTKYYAEHGQELIKKQTENGRNAIKDCKTYKDCMKDSIKHWKKETRKDDNEANKWNLLAIKAHYQVSKALIERMTIIARSTIKLIEKQHNFAIIAYMTMFSAIKRYAKPVTV